MTFDTLTYCLLLLNDIAPPGAFEFSFCGFLLDLIGTVNIPCFLFSSPATTFNDAKSHVN